MKGIPTIHQYQMYAATFMGTLAGVGYFFAPQDRTDFFQFMATGCAFFLFGKFTNGFGSTRKKTDDN